LQQLKGNNEKSHHIDIFLRDGLFRGLARRSFSEGGADFQHRID
jgi:hypothetical protein